MIIRKATEEDLDYIIRINLDILPEHYSIMFYKNLLYYHSDLFLVAEVDGKIVGYMMSRRESVDIVHIISIAVIPKYRRQGIGYELYKKLIGIISKVYEVVSIILEVRISNGGAISFYERMGLHRYEIRYGYYGDGENALIMGGTYFFGGS